MDTSIKIQHSKHFKIDPAKLNIGAIVLPETVITTIVVGDTIINKKVPLNEAFTLAEQNELKAQIEPLVIKAHQTATSVATVPTVQAQLNQPTSAPVPAPQQEDCGESLF